MTSRDGDGAAEKPSRLTVSERRQARERAGLKAPVIYESIRLEGEHELSRTTSALWWSGVGAGIGISTAVLCKAFLQASLPDEPWRPAISNLGYAVGFVIVIMGRLQLFTENTITVILPLLLNFTRKNVVRIARLWSIVFGANMAGCVLAAVMIAYGGILPPDQYAAALEISRHYAEASALQHFTYGAPAGFMIAALVWILPSTEGSGELFVIVLVTYMIGLGDLSHVVAGATELFILALTGEIGIGHALFSGVLPALVGNILGGTGLFAVLAYAQVREEI